MGLAKCIVPSCKDKNSRRMRLPHPTYDCYNRFWKWLALVQNPIIFTMDPMHVYRNKRICTRHFSPDRFVYGTRNLKRSALPDINIGETHKVIKDKHGNIRQDLICLDLKESSKENCTLKDIEIDDNVNNLAFEDNFEMTAIFSKEMVTPGGPIGRTFRACPSGGGTQPFAPSSPWPDSVDDPQENNEDCNSDCNTEDAPDLDHEGSADGDIGAPEIASTCDESESTVCSVKGGTDTLREMMEGYSKENSLDLFFTKAYQAARNMPQDLQNQIMKDILDSFARLENHHKLQASV